MLRNLSDVGYFPTLALRVSEMRALEELPNKDKDAFCPIILIAPWTTAKTLEKGVERVKKAYGDRPFIVDIDRYYEPKENGNPVQKEFGRLTSFDDGAKAWLDFVASIPNAVPCVQIHNISDQDLSAQIQAILELDRGFVVRREKSFGHMINPAVFDFLKAGGYANYAFVFDAGWSKDLLSEEVWFSQSIAQASDVNPAVPTVLCSASFPKEFGDCVGLTPLLIGMRAIHSRLQKNHNQQKVIYGDWASTRPRENRGGGPNTIERIDYPTGDQWVIVRNRDEEWSYLDAAKKLMASDHWNGDLKVWGSYEIEKTASGDAYGIAHAAHNVAARVNIHLHRQTWYDDPIAMLDTDDDWEDL